MAKCQLPNYLPLILFPLSTFSASTYYYLVPSKLHMEILHLDTRMHAGMTSWLAGYLHQVFLRWYRMSSSAPQLPSSPAPPDQLHNVRSRANEWFFFRFLTDRRPHILQKRLTKMCFRCTALPTAPPLSHSIALKWAKYIRGLGLWGREREGEVRDR